MTDFGTQTKSLFFAPKCVNSTLNPAPIGSACYNAPSQWMGHVKMKISDNPSACTDTIIDNIGNFSAAKIGDA
jgi:hypothetical protein